jgi:hypothetical protein
MFDSVERRHATRRVGRHHNDRGLDGAKSAGMRGVWGRRQVLVVEYHGRRGGRDWGVDCVIVPAYPEPVQTAFLAITPVCEA